MATSGSSPHRRLREYTRCQLQNWCGFSPIDEKKGTHFWWVVCWGSPHLHCHPSPLPLLSTPLCSSHPLSILLSAVYATPPLHFHARTSRPGTCLCTSPLMEINSLSCIVSLIIYHMQFTLIIFMSLCTHICDQTTFVAMLHFLYSISLAEMLMPLLLSLLLYKPYAQLTL